MCYGVGCALRSNDGTPQHIRMATVARTAAWCCGLDGSQANHHSQIKKKKKKETDYKYKYKKKTKPNCNVQMSELLGNSPSRSFVVILSCIVVFPTTKLRAPHIPITRERYIWVQKTRPNTISNRIENGRFSTRFFVVSFFLLFLARRKTTLPI